MDSSQKSSSCIGGGAPNTCFDQPTKGPPVPPLSRACGVCPPCPASCNVNAPPTPAEKELAKVTIELQQAQENFKVNATECAILRAELVDKKVELEKERCQHREVQNRLRALEMKFEGLTPHTDMTKGNQGDAFDKEVSVRTLKQSNRALHDEIDELRVLLKEQNIQLQDYRVKHMQSYQIVEEQRRQMDLMDKENTRISEQINLEIQRVKLKFQEKLQELAPIPDLMKATQIRMKDAQQAQALAEHNAEQFARELICAREKMEVLMRGTTKPAEKPADRGSDEKQLALLQQKISQLLEANANFKSEIDRYKAKVLRTEDLMLKIEKQLHDKILECTELYAEKSRVLDEAERALKRANERTEIIRKCLQNTVAELERQLAASRAQVRNAQKDREEVQGCMTEQISRLNDNFAQAQLRIIGLQTQVKMLRRTASSTGVSNGGEEGNTQECMCKPLFEKS